MAEPTIDSETGGGNTIPPLSGPGSKTPPTPGKGAGAPAPIGGGPDVKPKGVPGAPSLGGTGGAALAPAPKSPDEQADDTLMDRSVPTIVENVSDALNNIEASLYAETKRAAKINKNSVEEIIDKLLESGFTEQRLKQIAMRADSTVGDLFKKIAEKIKASGEKGAIDYLNKKFDEADAQQLTPVTPPPETLGKGPTAPPVTAGPEPTAQASFRTDVHLAKNTNSLKGENLMPKNTKIIITKEGTLEEVENVAANKYASALNNLVRAIRKTKRSINAFEDEKLKYAGLLAIKRAMDDKDDDSSMDNDSDMPDMDKDVGEDIDMDEDSGDKDLDKEKVLSGLDQLKDGIKSIEDAIKGVEGALDEEGFGGEEGGEEFPEKALQAENLTNIAEATIAKAREIIKTSSREIEAIAGEKKDVAGKGAKGGDPMEAQMGGKASKKDSKKSKKDDKKASKANNDEKDDYASEDEKDATATEALIRRVKARLSQLREEKEANLYPFKELQGPVEKVDNVNERNSNEMISTIDSEIKKKPVADKDSPTINAEMGQKDLPYKQEGQNASGKDVKPRTASAIQNAVDKAKLSVELASLQQLKGLVDNPLKTAFVKNMVDAGIPEKTASDIAHNAFIDGYEDAQQVVMKEAFSTFMKKPIDDFVKVSKFTKDYKAKEGIVLASVDDADSRKKEASIYAPLRGSQVGNHNDEYKKYWQDANRNRRGF